MIRFRPSTTASTPPGDLRRLIADAVASRHFFTGPATSLEWQHAAAEEVPWEVFQGRLLDPAHCSQRRTFEAWNVFLIEDGRRSAEPLLAVKLDAAAGQLHVVRAVYCYVHEGYHAGDNVYLTREVRRWVRELVGTVELARFASADDLRDELISLLFRAVVGASRLPLTSVEAPLPAFALGELAYFYGSETGDWLTEPARSWRELVERSLTAELSWLEKAKLLETLLHAVPPDELAAAAERFVGRWRALGHQVADIAALFRTLFNEVSLSPWTGLVERALDFLRLSEQKGYLAAAEVIELLAHLLRQTCRHLTAYDLVTFHHFGANYPDALLLNTLLKEYFRHIERYPHIFLDLGQAWGPPERRRPLRRALRQAWLLRRRYEGHLVPEAPTSQGENMRVLPAAFPRVPEEQILQPHRRDKRLFADDPLGARLGEHGRAALRQSILDLCVPREYRELGTALFLDRPLGAAKSPVEPDQTPLLSYEGFSPTIARHRFDWLTQHVDLVTPDEYADLRRSIGEAAPVEGVPVERIESASRPGTISLADARRVADDFALLRTTRRAVGDFLALFDFAPLAACIPLDWLAPERPLLIVGEAVGREKREVVIRIHDAGLRPRLELAADFGGGYACRAGIEYPANGLRVRRAEEEERGEGIVIPPAG
jgi:hypothetical protein